MWDRQTNSSTWVSIQKISCLTHSFWKKVCVLHALQKVEKSNHKRKIIKNFRLITMFNNISQYKPKRSSNRVPTPWNLKPSTFILEKKQKHGKNMKLFLNFFLNFHIQTEEKNVLASFHMLLPNSRSWYQPAGNHQTNYLLIYWFLSSSKPHTCNRTGISDLCLQSTPKHQSDQDELADRSSRRNRLF